MIVVKLLKSQDPSQKITLFKTDNFETSLAFEGEQFMN